MKVGNYRVSSSCMRKYIETLSRIDWTEILLFPALVKMIIKISQRVFVGERISKNPEWVSQPTILLCCPSHCPNKKKSWKLSRIVLVEPSVQSLYYGEFIGYFDLWWHGRCHSCVQSEDTRQELRGKYFFLERKVTRRPL